MTYQPYDGPVIDLDQKHYHRWHLGLETTGTGIDGKPWRNVGLRSGAEAILRPTK